MTNSASSKNSQPQLIDIKPLVEEGLSVHLLKRKKKSPIDEMWGELPTLSYEQLERRHRPGQNFGIRLGKWSPVTVGKVTYYLHVFDLDINDPATKAEAYEALTKLFPEWEDAPRVRSGSGGESRHFYALLTEPRLRKSILVRSQTKITIETPKGPVTKDSWHIELYGNTGQVAIPPSIHPSGNPYVWEIELMPLLDMGLVPVIPPEVVATWKPQKEDDPEAWESGGAEDLDEILEKLEAFENYDWLIDAMGFEPDQGQRSTHCQNVMLNLMKRGCTDDEIDILANEYSFANKFKDRETGWTLKSEIENHRKTWKLEGCKVTPKDAGDLDFDDVSGEDDSDDAANDNKPKSPKPFKFPMILGGDIEPVLDGNWLIYEVVPATGLMMIYGLPGTGKSFVALDVGLHIAAGLPWGGLDTEQGPVIYIAAEGSEDFKNRVYAAYTKLGIDRKTTPFYVITVAPNLGKDSKDLPILKKEIDRQLEIAGCGAPAVIFLDTVARVITGSDENTSEGMGAFIENADNLGKHYKCLSAGVHHAGKDVSRGMRGWSGLNGACDAVWEITNESDEKTKKPNQIYLPKMKAGPSLYVLATFELARVEVGKNKKGKPITTCVPDITVREEADFDDVEKEETHKVAAVAALKDGPYRTDVQSKEKADGTKGWFGLPIAAALGLNPADEGDRRTIRKLVDDLISEGKLERFTATAHRNKVEFIKVVETESRTSEVADDFENEDFAT